ncbi:MAG: class I SAM-dependent methyltransferase, partial [Candidatus Moraniibacteriota bacterium]
MKTNEGLLRRYDKISHRWNCKEYAGLRRDDLIPKILKYSNLKSLPPKSEILDAMCGTGKIGETLNKELKTLGKISKISFTDFSQAMLNQIKTPGSKILSDIRKTGLPENTFDRIFLRGALHDLPKKAQPDAIKEVYRLLKNDGLFVLIAACSEKDT